MDIANPSSGERVALRADNIVERADGKLVVESLFSGIVDLSSATADLGARIHPMKAKAFGWIVSKSVAVTADEIEDDFELVSEVELHVNNPQGEIIVRRFSSIASDVRTLVETGKARDVKRTLPLQGFEPTAEPVIREMLDGTLLLVFYCLPPLIGEDSGFDMESFGAELNKAVGVPLIWDDREVFVIKQPVPNTIERLCGFVSKYWDFK